MIGPVEISSRNIELSGEMESLIREKVKKLENFYNGMIGCRIMVDVPHRRRQKGDQFNVRIDMTVPGGELVVKKEYQEDLHVAVTNAFNAAERQLKEFAERQRRDVKVHEERPRALVSKLFPDEGYGFLTTPEGEEIYFHKNSVTDVRFEDLKIGLPVNFVRSMGEKGAQASMVAPA